MKAATAVLRGAAIPVAAALVLVLNSGLARAQTNPTPQSLPYAQDFRSLPHTSTAYPAGWQGWTNGNVGAAFLTTGPTADQALVASGTAALGTGAVYNYNGKFGPLNSGSLDFGLGFAVNTTGASGVVVRYEVMTMRNPHNGGANTRINEIALQYRVGTTGAWTTLASTGYQNNTTTQTGNVTTPQKIEYRGVTLPSACDNQSVVELRWAQRQVSGAGARPSFAVDNVVVEQPVAGSPAAGLSFDGVDDYVTLGQAPAVGATNFTIETWFKRTGPGTSTNTGAGGINIIPLVAKGFAENDGSAVDMNFILGIRPFAGPVIGIDYEEGTGQTAPGQNHPLWGTTPVLDNVWYHAAATFDGTTLRVYLNGALESTLNVGAARLPQSNSIQHASLGTALGSNGAIPVGETQGLFLGILDESRIWNVAHSECEIAAGMNQELASGTGLLARFGMNEGEGLSLANSVGSPHGILMNGPTWVAGSSFDAVSPAAPAAPAGLSATAPDAIQIALGWTDMASNENGFRVERSTTGPGGPFTLIATLGANANSYTDGPLSAATEYCYRVRATGDCGFSAYSSVACATTLGEQCRALAFDPDGAGTDAYISLGNPAPLQLGALTLELWMQRNGDGAGTATGGIADLIPLISKGRDEAESSSLDLNYILGIRASDGVLAADFEEGAGGSSPSANHPVVGTTSIANGSWHHVAATYDGTTWKLYLDGALEASLAVGQPMAAASTLPVAIASALNSSSTADGFFDGAIDEVRVWNYARTQAQIQDEINSQITSAQSGLVGRWALDEAVGAVAYGTAGTGIHGTIAGSSISNWDRTGCAPFDVEITHDITATAGANGSIAPAGVTAVAHHGSQMYTITADACYAVADVLVDGVSVGPVTLYTFVDVRESHTISASFAIASYAITASAGTGGSIAPNGETLVECGADQVFTITPGACYTIADVLVDGFSVGAVPTHTFTNVQATHTIAASFSIKMFSIDATAGTGGSIEPSGPSPVACGSDQMFTISPEACYTIADVLIDGVSVGPVGFYTFTDVQADHTISASFVLSGPFTIEASAGEGGSITPDGSTIVACGGSQAYTIVAADCHVIADVLIDGASIGAVAAFTFSSVQQNHTIAVTFSLATSTITAQTIGSGTISPAGNSIVACGDELTYTITPDPGFIIAKVVVDGQGVGNDPSYTFTDVQSDHTITAVFGQTTAVEDLPREFALSRIAPNPVRDRTTIEFAVATEANIKLSVIDVTGHEVRVLAEGKFPPGRHTVAWNGRTSRGGVAAPGIYFVSYMKPGGRQVRKLIMTR
jgi:Concanavalin A-like lectin/glucanases superfamily/Divergent InlB B-repeat domain